MSAQRLAWLGLGVLLLVVAAAVLWLLPAYVLPPMAVSQRPSAHTDPLPAAAPVTSYVSIPLVLSIENIKKLVREELSGKLLAKNVKVPGRNLSVSIDRNGTLALWVRDADLHMVMPIKFRTQGDLSTKGELTIFTRASFNVSEDWQPLVDARSTFRWDWQPRVGIWPFRFRIGSRLSPYIQAALDKGAQDFQSQTAGLYDLRSIANGAWERFFGPHPLDQDKQLWLSMQPHELFMEPITSDQNEVRLNIWMSADLGIVEGVQPPAAQKKPLPRLNRSSPPGKTVSLAAPILVEYAHMLPSLSQALVGHALPSTQGSLTLSEVELYGSGQDVVLGVVFEGRRNGGLLPTRGRVYLSGQPQYDPATQTLSVHHLKLTEPSLNPLSHGARWVLEDAPNWSAELERRMTWAIAERITQKQQQLDASLNRTINHRFDLWGKTSQLTVSGAHPQQQGVALDALADGELELLFVP